MLHVSFWYFCPFCYESTWRPTIFLQNISDASNVFAHSCRCRSSAFLLITNRLSSFWKRIVPTKYCSAMCSRLTINFLNNFKCFCGIKTSISAKTNCCTLFSCIFHYNLWHEQNKQVTSHVKYVSHCELYELKLSMHIEEGLLTNFPKFHGDLTTNTMFSQCCCKTYQTDLVYVFHIHLYVPNIFLALLKLLVFSTWDKWGVNYVC